MNKHCTVNTIRSLLMGAFFFAALAQAADKPNILVIWGDDIGYWNISRYSLGMMGYPTPGIDRIAEEGVTYTRLVGSLQQFPPRQRPGSFTVDQILEAVYKK